MVCHIDSEGLYDDCPNYDLSLENAACVVEQAFSNASRRVVRC
jgi:hypothetical protein